MLDFLPLLRILVRDTRFVQNVASAAAVFHATLCAGLAEWVKHAALQNGITLLALGGGCFHNDVLLQGLKDRLNECPIDILIAKEVLPDDSAIALGQAWVAIQSMQELRQKPIEHYE